MRKINRLGEVFAEVGVYNRQIAKFVGKSESTVSLWVNNRRQPSVEDMNAIAEFLRRDIRELFYPSDWSESTLKPFKDKVDE
jgi:putative transcriptional regulator